MLVPRELGGLQVDTLTFYQVVEALVLRHPTEVGHVQSFGPHWRAE
jgi:hypothetical protein